MTQPTTMTDTATTSTTIATLVALLKVAEGRHADAVKAYADTDALPKGSRGKASALKVADARRAEAFAGVVNLRNHVTEAKRRRVMAWLAGLISDATDPVLRQIFDAKGDRLRCRVALDLSAYCLGVVCAEVSFSETGMPDYIEIRKLGDLEERVAIASSWLKRATTDAGRKEALEILANPSAFVHYSGKTPTGSVTVGASSNWSCQAKTQAFTLNASTWQAVTDEDAGDAWRLVGAADLVRRKLNALAFPSASVISERLDA